LIEVERLTKRYGAFTAVRDLSFVASKGSVVGFLGQNGAGKTTTLRVVSCFLPPTEGAVRVCGFDTVARSAEVRRRIGYLPESVPLYVDMRVSEYLRFRARLKGVEAREVAKAVEEAARRCLVYDVLHRIVGTLSKGFRQRVGLADAVVHRPEVLILDEPTSGLDPNQRVEVRSLVRDLAGERTVLVSTHILPEVEAACDRVLVVHKGGLVADRALSELRRGGGFRARYRDASGVEKTETIDDQGAASARAAAIVKSGGVLLELTPAVESLESVFARLTSGSDV
jgi:ABC-2 type transport system ATP-binding protein